MRKRIWINKVLLHIGINYQRKSVSNSSIKNLKINKLDLCWSNESHEKVFYHIAPINWAYNYPNKNQVWILSFVKFKILIRFSNLSLRIASKQWFLYLWKVWTLKLFWWLLMYYITTYIIIALVNKKSTPIRKEIKKINTFISNKIIAVTKTHTNNILTNNNKNIN